MNATADARVVLDAGLARVVFRETPGNVLSLALVGALGRALATLAADLGIKLITLEGEGRDFSFGASIPGRLPDRIGRALRRYQRVSRKATAVLDQFMSRKGTPCDFTWTCC